MNKKTKFVIGIISILYIMYSWIKKDIVSIYASSPNIVFIIATSIFVSLIKVSVIVFILIVIKNSMKKRD